MIKLILKFKKNNIHAIFTHKNKTLYKISFNIEKKNNQNKNIKTQIIVEKLGFFIRKLNSKIKKEIKILLFIEGYNNTKFPILKALQIENINFFKIYYIFNKPFNGCKKKRERRILYYIFLR